MLTLDPEHYECPDHRVDLTDQVYSELDYADPPPPVAYRGSLRGVLFGGRRAKPRSFQVKAICPGRDGSGEHRLTCEGTWTR